LSASLGDDVAVVGDASRARTPWHLSTGGVVAVATGLTLVALAENTLAPWAPFYVVYATLATALPLAWRTFAFGDIRRQRVSTWALAILLPAALQLFAAEAARGPFHSLGPALPRLFEAAGERLGMEPWRVGTIYLTSIVAWAGTGEELFYRGYMHGVLRRRHGFWLSALVASAFFGLRHATQLALIRPGYPWGAALSWVTLGFLIGLCMSWLYERSGSLYPPVIAHYLFNLIPMVLLLAS
jgi:membrane protease YdiL (CAAX protease family)